MARGRGGRGGRSGRSGGGHNGSKQRFYELNTNMVNAPRLRNERYSHNRDSNTDLHTQHERRNCRGVGKTSKASSQDPQYIFSDVPHSQEQPDTKADALDSVFPASNPSKNISRRATHRASIVTCVSALSTQAGTRGLYCYNCAGTNRKLRQAMLDLLETTLKNGNKLIAEWAFEAGVSADHMECERTKRNLPVPEVRQCEGEPCSTCNTEFHSNTQCQHRLSLNSARASQASDPPSYQVPSHSLHHQPLVSLQQESSPLESTRPGSFLTHSDLVAVPQTSHSMSWTAPRNMGSIPEQEMVCIRSTENASQPAHFQTRQYPYQQQRHDSKSCRAWQLPQTYPDTQARHQSIQRQEQPDVDPTWGHPIRDALAIDRFQQKDSQSAAQETHEPQTSPQAHMPLTLSWQKPFYQQQTQQRPLSSHPVNPFACTFIPVLGQGAEIPVDPSSTEVASARTLLSPPPSYEIKIPGMLNRTNEVQQFAQEPSSSAAIGNGTEAPAGFYEQQQFSAGAVEVYLDRVQMAPTTADPEPGP